MMKTGKENKLSVDGVFLMSIEHIVLYDIGDNQLHARQPNRINECSLRLNSQDISIGYPN